jgi:hypothetical protein
MPRQQHYFFAHRVLPGLFFQDPTGFAKAIERDGALLRRLWRRSGSFWSRLFGGGNVTCAKRKLPDGSSLLVIAPPAPLRTTEAHFVGLLLAPAVREAAVYTLERHDSLEGEVTTVLGGWVGDSHANYGDGPEPTVDAFVEAVCSLRKPGP